ncbi:MAG: Gldg family protein [Planctomycetes bacterium]|nr:Gldg family protein [Planctomycetota bacterium]
MINRKRSYTMHFLLLSILTAVALAAVNYLALAHRARLDLTADKRFTLSEGTQRLFESLTEGVHVTYFVDEEPPPKRINLERDVRDKLQELAVSSGGKLTWSIERITAAEAQDKLEELEKRSIQKTIDVLTSGTDESARMKGFQGYFSSIEIKYGLAEPVVINGVRNLVDKLDEATEHRVDTLEFDISFAVLQIRAKGGKAPIRRLVKTLKDDITITLHTSEQMPAKNPTLGETINNALNALAQESPRVKVQRSIVPFGRVLSDGRQAWPYGKVTEEETVDSRDPTRKGPKFYYTVAAILYQGRYDVVFDFADETTTESVLTKIEGPLQELLRPRTKLGFVLPPGDIDPRRQPGQPAQTPYSDAVEYIRRTFGYEADLIDLGTSHRIPRDLAVLIAFEPNQYAERDLYEIDRYLAEGGNVVMLYQGWDAKLEVMGRFRDTLALNKNPTTRHFEDWCKFHGIQFGQDALFDKGGSMTPYRRSRQGSEQQPTNIPLAVVVEPRDLNGDSIYGRWLAGMPLPFPVEIRIDDAELAANKIERQDVIALRDDIYRFIPANPAFPEIPLRVSLDSPAEVEKDPEATPGKDIRFQRTKDPVLVATSLRGTFRSYWDADGRAVPAWARPPAAGDPVAGQRAPEVKSRPGSLLLCSSAGTLNIEYLWGYGYEEAVNVVIPKGSTFFKNMAETHIYGEDLVRLRVRTGVAPRLSGELSEGRRLWWLFVCIGGIPLMLLAAGMVRNLAQARARQDYEAALGAGPKE